MATVGVKGLNGYLNALFVGCLVFSHGALIKISLTALIIKKITHTLYYCQLTDGATACAVMVWIVVGVVV